jgi:hypothetical protein
MKNVVFTFRHIKKNKRKKNPINMSALIFVFEHFQEGEARATLATIPVTKWLYISAKYMHNIITKVQA